MYKWIILILIIPLAGWAQTNTTAHERNVGKVIDKLTGEPLPFVTIKFSENEKLIYETTTNFEGEFFWNPESLPQTARITAQFVGYLRYKAVLSEWPEKEQVVLRMEQRSTIGEECIIYTCPVPMLERDGGSSGYTFTRDDMRRIPLRR